MRCACRRPRALHHRYGHARQSKLTETQLDVFKLITDGRELSDYVPRYRPGAHRGIGAFPMTIASRAAEQLVQKGLIERDEIGHLRPTRAGWELQMALTR